MKTVSSLTKSILTCACASSLLLTPGQLQAQAPQVQPSQVKTIWVIILENRNFTYGTDASGGSQIAGNAAAPYLNSLITPGNANAAQVSYCSCYHNDLATPTGSNPSIHPSEPNYVWGESGNNLSKLDDNDPYLAGNPSVGQMENYLLANPTVSGQHLSGLLQAAGISWKAYVEEIDHQNSTGGNGNLSGSLTETVLPQSQWTMPLSSFSGANASYTNPYNGSDEWNFACKHTGELFYLDTNGSTLSAANTSTSNTELSHYAPLEQLATDLANNTVAAYNTITPDQYNDMHTALSAGFTYNGTHYTGDLAQVAQGDNFCSIIVPQIMASQAYKNNGAIIIWTDETEGTNQNDFNHTLTEIVISPLAKGNAYNSLLNYTHSSDIATEQEIFQVAASTPTGYLNDAANLSNSSGAYAGVGDGSGAAGFGTGGAYGGGQALDLSDLFQSGVIPSSLPSMRVSASGYTINGRAKTATQTVTVTNSLSSALTGGIYIAVGNLNTTLNNSAGTTQNNAPLGSPYVSVTQSGLAAGASASVVLQFALPATGGIIDTLNPINTSGQP